MKVGVDTSALWGLINGNDHWHALAKDEFRAIRRSALKLAVPRIVLVETMGHVSNVLRGQSKESRKGFVKYVMGELDRLDLEVIEDTADDYDHAAQAYAKFADWPLGYVDALIATTLNRTKPDSIWTYDENDLSRFLRHQYPKMKIRGTG